MFLRIGRGAGHTGVGVFPMAIGVRGGFGSGDDAADLVYGYPISVDDVIVCGEGFCGQFVVCVEFAADGQAGASNRFGKIPIDMRQKKDVFVTFNFGFTA